MSPSSRPARRSLVLLALASLVAASCAADDRVAVSPVDIELGTADGGSTTLADESDGLLVVNLWATWCGPCVAEMPVFDEVAAARAADATELGINVGDTAAEAVAFAADLGVDVTPRLKTLKVTDPPGRSAGIKVPDVATLVDKLKNEAKVI